MLDSRSAAAMKVAASVLVLSLLVVGSLAVLQKDTNDTSVLSWLASVLVSTAREARSHSKHSTTAARPAVRCLSVADMLDSRSTAAMEAAAPALVLLLLAVGTLAELQKECTPGETKKMDCNSCFCTKAGVWLCPRMACNALNIEVSPDEEATRVRRSAGYCAPGKTFQKGCNKCACNREGTAAVCTLKACLAHSTQEASCTPGATYKEGCNMCRCRADGKSGACTRKACPRDTS